MDQIKIGDYIEIIKLNSSQQKKKRKNYKGEVSFIGLNGLYFGTWGHFTIDPEVDEIKKLNGPT